MMHSKSLFLGAAALLGVVALQCSKSREDLSNPKHLTLIGGAPGGGWAATMEGVAESIRKGLPGVEVTMQPGEDAPNVVRIARQEGQLAMAYSPTVRSARVGKEPFKEAYPTLRALCGLRTAVCQAVVLEKTGLNSLAEVKEKKYPLLVSLNVRGSSMAIISEAILDAYGVRLKDIESWGGQVLFLPINPVSELIRDGKANALFSYIAIPVPQFLDLSTTHHLKLLSLEEPVRKKIIEEFGVLEVRIPPKTYPFQEGEVVTIGFPDVLVIHEATPEALAYEMLKSIYDNRDYLGTVHVSLKGLTAKRMREVGGVPLHPGAERFFREQGVL
ncbi:MAG: TAXI family TRAP transporter solute-binding subunit [Acidobacteria bacterium]|nr:TAXI family TRAP transporter solute-binding subunit [Acidobacteriota bacterium]